MRKKFLTLCMFVSIFSASSGRARSLPVTLQKKVDSFSETSTQKAQMILRQFTIAELQQITYAYKKQATREEARMLWLIEEYHLREADRIASERILYLFLALILLFILILVFIFRIWKNSLSEAIPVRLEPGLIPEQFVHSSPVTKKVKKKVLPKAKRKI